MASQEQPLRRSKRGRKPPKSLSEATTDQGDPDTQAHRNVHTEVRRSKRVQYGSSAHPGGMDANTTATRGKANSTKPRNRDSHAKKSNSIQWLKQGTGRALTTFASNRLQVEFVEVTSAKGFDLVCTYNWRNDSLPSIYVPGAPPNFISRQCPVSLPKDTGFQFIDQNAYRVPDYPFEPIFQALSVMDPGYNFTSVDLVTNRNSLRKLLDFAEGRVRDSFRIDLSIIGGTLFLSRHERKLREKLNAYNSAGFGHNFEKAFSAPQEGLEGSTGHHRVIKYVLGNLNCVVRYEVDACCDTHGGMPGSNEGEHKPQQGENDVLDSFSKLSLSTGTAQPGENDVLDSFSNLSISTGTTQPPNPNKTPRQMIEVTPRGTTVPTTRTAEVKTRSNPVNLRNTLPQLWFGRTPHLRIGMHQEGKFTHIESINAAEKFANWEQTYQTPLRKVVRLISELRKITKESGGNCVAVYNHNIKPPQLEVFEAKDKETLPADLIEKFWRKE